MSQLSPATHIQMIGRMSHLVVRMVMMMMVMMAMMVVMIIIKKQEV